MLSSCYQCHGIITLADMYTVPSHQIIEKSGKSHNVNTDIQLLDTCRKKQMKYTFINNQNTGKRNQDTFHWSRNLLHLSMTERMTFVFRLCRPTETVQTDSPCKYIHNTLHGVGQNADWIGQPIGSKLTYQNQGRNKHDPSLHFLLELFFVHSSFVLKTGNKFNQLLRWMFIREEGFKRLLWDLERIEIVPNFAAEF